MKKYIIIATISFLSCLLIAQEKSELAQTKLSATEDSMPKNTESNQLNEMLVESLRSCIKYDSDVQSRLFKNQEKSKIYICLDGLPADFPFESMQHENVSFITLKNLGGLSKTFQKELKKGIGAYFVWIRLINNKIIITVDSRVVKLVKRNNVNIAVGGWGIFNYEYSCENQKWLLGKIEYGGI